MSQYSPTSSNNSFADKVVLITGGTAGIGSAAAVAFVTGSTLVVDGGYLDPVNPRLLGKRACAIDRWKRSRRIEGNCQKLSERRITHAKPEGLPTGGINRSTRVPR